MISIPNVSILPHLFVLSTVCFDPAANYLWPGLANPNGDIQKAPKHCSTCVGSTWVSAKPLLEASVLVVCVSLGEMYLVPYQPESY